MEIYLGYDIFEIPTSDLTAGDKRFDLYPEYSEVASNVNFRVYRPFTDTLSLSEQDKGTRTVYNEFKFALFTRIEGNILKYRFEAYTRQRWSDASTLIVEQLQGNYVDYNNFSQYYKITETPALEQFIYLKHGASFEIYYIDLIPKTV